MAAGSRQRASDLASGQRASDLASAGRRLARTGSMPEPDLEEDQAKQDDGRGKVFLDISHGPSFPGLPLTLCVVPVFDVR